MSAQDDRDFQQWTRDWQAGTPRDVTTEEQIRHYVKRRSGLLWSFMVSDFVIGAIALPILVYFSVAARNEVERLSMISLASITVAAIGFGWWNWRGVLRSSAASTAEYLAISAERLRRLRLAWRIGWVVLTGEVVVFVDLDLGSPVFRRAPARRRRGTLRVGLAGGIHPRRRGLAGVVRTMDHSRRRAVRGACDEN